MDTPKHTSESSAIPNAFPAGRKPETIIDGPEPRPVEEVGIPVRFPVKPEEDMLNDGMSGSETQKEFEQGKKIEELKIPKPTEIPQPGTVPDPHQAPGGVPEKQPAPAKNPKDDASRLENRSFG